MVRYVHLPGSSVDTALLEDGLFRHTLLYFFMLTTYVATRREAAQQASKAK